MTFISWWQNVTSSSCFFVLLVIFIVIFGVSIITGGLLGYLYANFRFLFIKKL